MKQARKPRSYASPKLRPTQRLRGVKCRATSVAKNLVDNPFDGPKMSKVVILSSVPFFLDMLVSLSCCLSRPAHLRPSSFVSTKTNQQNLTNKV